MTPAGERFFATVSAERFDGLPFAIDRMVPLPQAAVAPPPGRPAG